MMRIPKNISEGGNIVIGKKEVLKKTTKLVASVATNYLKLDANSASCIMFNQPKAPIELNRFKKIR